MKLNRFCLLGGCILPLTALHFDDSFSFLKSYLDCWDLSEKNDVRVFHLHIPKVAGCSVVKDLSDMVGREQVFSDEVCFSYSLANGASYENTVVMVREPRDHVYSMYQFCNLAVDPGYRFMVGKRHGLKGQAKYSLAESFSAWINEWHENPRWGNYDIYEDQEFCYCPYNMQSSRLACNSDKTAKYCHESANIEIAKQNLQKATVVGILEAYHESVCLFSARLLGSLPEHCDCESTSWNAYSETNISHHDQIDEPYGGINDMPQDTIQKVDDMTKEDRLLYQAAVQRFIKDIKEVELHFGKRILYFATLNCNNCRTHDKKTGFEDFRREEKHAGHQLKFSWLKSSAAGFKLWESPCLKVESLMRTPRMQMNWNVIQL